MLQLETIEDSYSFHSYDENSAKIIKPNRNIHASDQTEDNFITVSSTTLVYQNQLDEQTFPRQFAAFNQDSIEKLCQYEADIFLVGTGNQASFPARDLLQFIARQKLAIDFMDTGAACRTFNILTGEYRKVAALIFFA
jgi:uncharacterized protein